MSITTVTTRISRRWLERKTKHELASIVLNNLDRIDLFRDTELRTLARDDRQQEIAHWALRVFGPSTMSLPHRAIRHAEEAIEAAQSAGCDPAMLHKLVDHICSRPAGSLPQEIGGCGITLLALAHAAGVSADAEEAREAARVLAIPPEHWHARDKAKKDAGFDAT